MEPFLKRGLLGRIEASLASVPVLILEGPRASGKTSIGTMLADRALINTTADLGDPTVLAAAASAPTSFVNDLSAPAFIDEAQLVPEIALAVKRRVDRERRPGMFVLTGSSRLGTDNTRRIRRVGRTRGADAVVADDPGRVGRLSRQSGF